jgi:two-component system, chemotaxis family, CheB/CheR fusion protein
MISPTAPSERDPTAAAFPLVGIGASAGGLEAIGELLSALPADTGMAFLVVQHLDPTHSSMLDKILAKKTAMAVKEARDGELIAPNHVYIIAPNTTMSVAGRHLRLRPRVDAPGPPTPIDALFESIAHDVTQDAIGVILSGTGSDGALGMQAIKGEGGITFAQDEASARFRAMPRAAVDMGCVDSVLSPAAIAAALARIARHPMPWREPAVDSAGPDVDDEFLTRIFGVLRSACDIDFSQHKRGTIRRRLERRLVLHQLTTLTDYLALLEADPAEAHALGQDFLINVTAFFRDPESFADLTRIVWPRLLEGRSGKTPMRIWVPGCASGEEVYSIAISLLEYLGDRAAVTPVQIFGTDVSEAAIETARAGRYIENVARDLSPERLQCFFVNQNRHYQVNKAVRGLCIFSRHNVLRDPPFSRLDLVSCRNLLIYLDPAAQKRLMSVFHYALNPGGILTLGVAESIGTASELFRTIENARSKIYLRKAAPVHAQAEVADTHATWRPDAPAVLKEAAAELEPLQREADRIVRSRFVPAGVLCDEALNIMQFRGDTGPYLVQPPGPPTVRLEKLACPALLIEVGTMIQQVRKTGQPVRRAGARIEFADGVREIGLEVFGVRPAATAQRGFLICFEPVTTAPTGGVANRWSALFAWLRRDRRPQGGDGELARVRQELEASRNYVRTRIEEHQSALEELKSAQEELMSSNEEFQSTNEELETAKEELQSAKEELQSANEELATTNDELRHRNNELHELADRLQEARDYADAIVATAHEPLVVLDASQRVMRVNEAFCRSFNVTREESKHALFYELGNRQWDIPELRRLLDETLGAGRSFQDHAVTHDFPGIGRKTMRLNARHLNWPEHSLILLAIEDVTKDNAILQALRDEELRKNEFLAMLGHELRNPLAAMRNALYVSEHANANTADIGKANAIMRRQLDIETRLVDDLLDLSRITLGVIVIERKPFDLPQLIRTVAEEMHHEIDARHHALTLALPAESLFIDGDATRIAQVVTNLIGNSAKFTAPGGRIGVTLKRHRHQAELTITDNGAGIAPEMLPSVFDLFVQAKGTPDRANGGLGLGLTLARRIVELHGGSIHGESPGLNQGATFVVYLPALTGVKALPSTVTAANIERAQAIPRRILVVDDNADLVASTVEWLRMNGHEVATATDGPSALTTAVTFAPQVVLLDIGLPGLDGHEVARRLRRLPQTETALLIALSGYGQGLDQERSLEAGFDHHLVKPADPAHIDALIAAGRATDQ